MITLPKEYMMDESSKEIEESPGDILGRQEAAAYLGRLWNRPFTVKDLNNLRTNHGEEIAQLGVKPVTPRGWAVWRRSDLDAIAKAMTPRYREEVRKPRKRRKTES